MFFSVPVVDCQTCYKCRWKMFGVFWSVRKSNSYLSKGKITIGNKTFNRAAMRLRRVHRCLRTKYKISFESNVGRSGSIFEKKNRIELGIFFSKISDWICCIFKMRRTRCVTRKIQSITYGHGSETSRLAFQSLKDRSPSGMYFDEKLCAVDIVVMYLRLVFGTL